MASSPGRMTPSRESLDENLLPLSSSSRSTGRSSDSRDRTAGYVRTGPARCHHHLKSSACELSRVDTAILSAGPCAFGSGPEMPTVRTSTPEADVEVVAGSSFGEG